MLNEVDNDSNMKDTANINEIPNDNNKKYIDFKILHFAGIFS